MLVLLSDLRGGTKGIGVNLSSEIPVAHSGAVRADILRFRVRGFVIKSRIARESAAPETLGRQCGIQGDGDPYTKLPNVCVVSSACARRA